MIKSRISILRSLQSSLHIYSNNKFSLCLHTPSISFATNHTYTHPNSYTRSMSITTRLQGGDTREDPDIPPSSMSEGNCPNERSTIDDNDDMIMADLNDKLSKMLPTRFYLNNNSKNKNIELLYNPKDFYYMLLNKISNAKERIFLTSLYLGKTEDEFIDAIMESMRKKPQLKVYFLLDGLRCTRELPNKSSVTLISRLLEKFGKERVVCHLYRTPAYHGWKSKIIPRRFNEGLGLQHMKFYGFDQDEIIMTGANLSNDYFSDRQDRYYVFNSNQLNNYYFKILNVIGSLSYNLVLDPIDHSPILVWPQTNPIIEPKKNKHKFISQSSIILNRFFHDENKYYLSLPRPLNDDWSTVIYPISQLTPLFHKDSDKSTELPTILSIFKYIHDENSLLTKKKEVSRCTNNNISWIFTAGYFNMISAIKRKLLETNSMNSTVITASPMANGFYQSKGVSKYLPEAYLHLSYKFLRDVSKYEKHTNNNKLRISLREWQEGIANQPNGWSYHAKGIWLHTQRYQENNSSAINPFLTIIGSSNYTKRSYSLDLESNVLILTRDPDLRSKMGMELDNLLKHTHNVALSDFKNDHQRHVKPGVKVATKLLGGRL